MSLIVGSRAFFALKARSQFFISARSSEMFRAAGMVCQARCSLQVLLVDAVWLKTNKARP
jgi:hypothetical protein